LKHVIPFDILDLRRPHGIFLNDRYFGIGARPFLIEGDRLCVTSWTDIGIYYTVAEGWWPDLCAYNLAWVDLKDRKILDRRRYLSGRLQVFCRYYQHDYGPGGRRRRQAGQCARPVPTLRTADLHPLRRAV
jgi:hypothetical protein